MLDDVGPGRRTERPPQQFDESVCRRVSLGAEAVSGRSDIAVTKKHRLHQTRAHQLKGEMQTDQQFATAQLGRRQGSNHPDVIVSRLCRDTHPATLNDQVDPASVAENHPKTLLP